MLNLGNVTRMVALAAVLVVAMSVLSGGRSERASADGECGPMDVVFLIDDTGSMGGAITTVQAGVVSILSDINAASGGDYKLGLVSFKDNVVVLNDLAAGNTASVQANILALVASGGAGMPEASDEALNTVIKGLDAADRPVGKQTGDFNGVWRSGAVKIAIVITDSLPGGFDDTYTVGVDDVNAHQRALDALAAGIKISAVYVPTGSDVGQKAVLQDYAAVSGGSFIETASDGSSTAHSIAAIIAACGGSVCPPSAPGAAVNTCALVDPGTLPPPNIECKWELPDMQPGVSNPLSYPDTAVQYGTATNVHQHDDDMTVVPDADNNPSNGIQIPCSGPPGAVPSMPDGVRSMIQVAPVPEDDPEQRHIQLWMAVDHPNNISNITKVYWRVWEPAPLAGLCPDRTAPTDGWCVKVEQVDGTKVDKAECNTITGRLGTGTAVGKMFEAAVHTGQVAAAAVDNVDKGMRAKCSEEEKAIYYASFDLSKEQPCGKYKIQATAVGVGGKMDKLTNYLDVLCVFYLRIDFNKVDWGTVTPGLKDIVSGDLLWDKPADNAPTVKNVGNSGMGLGLHFSKMVGVNEKKEITIFDAKFGRSPDTLQEIDPIAASTPVQFDKNRERVLCANEKGKLDLSIHPPVDLPQDLYLGTVDVIGRLVPGICEPIIE